MRKRSLVIVAMCCMLFVSVNTASAWYLEMNNADGDGTVDVWFRMEGGDGQFDLTTYAADFYYDSTELEYSSFTDSAPGGWTVYTPEEWTTGDGWVRMYGIQADGDSQSNIITADTLLCTYTFTVLEGAVKDGENDVWWFSDDHEYYGLSVYIETGYGTSDYEWYQFQRLVEEDKIRMGSGLDLGTSAVPVPAAVWLLGSGLVGLLGLRRRDS
jgi:hypothetical protein